MKKKLLPIVLLLTGLVLLYFGQQEYHSIEAEVRRLAGYSVLGKAYGLMITGAALSIAGFAGLVRRNLDSEM